MRLKPRFLLHPCESDGTCLVKASCILKRNRPWMRDEECPIYIKWEKADKFYQTIIAIINASFWILLILAVLAFIAGTFIMGLWKEWELIKGWWF